jgi:hypothetical protein
MLTNPNDLLTPIPMSGRVSGHAQARPTFTADRTSGLQRNVVPWLCLLLAIATITAALQLVAAAVPVSTGSATDSFAELDLALPPTLPSGAMPLTRANALPADTGQRPVQCDEVSNHVAADVLVAMTTEELRYLESTLCQTLGLPEHSDS